MNTMKTKGRVHSFQSLGTVDGPGVRFVVFLQGCHLRCGCCHNPDTWDVHGGNEYTVEDILSRVQRYQPYFGSDGGITVTGGEPLLQAAFVKELFVACHRIGIHTCLDTSGAVWNSAVAELLSETDRVLLDIKYTDEISYRHYVGCEMSVVLRFLEHLDREKIATTIRQVILPSLNDSHEQIFRLRELVQHHSCVDTVELLPFRKLCTEKYDSMGIPFAFSHIPEPSQTDMTCLEALVRSSTV